MGLSINDTAPDFEAKTTQGTIKFHDWIGDSWAVLFSHPKDFTPICTTELGYMAKIEPEFAKRGVKIIGLSVDATGDHAKWADDIEETQGTRPNYPIIADDEFKVAMRQVAAAFSQLEKTRLVKKLKSARDRKRQETGEKVGGRRSVAEMHPETAALAHKLARKRPKGGQRSLREIATELAAAGHMTSNGTPYTATAVKRLLEEARAAVKHLLHNRQA